MRWTAKTETRLRWAVRGLLRRRFGDRFRDHYAARPPEHDVEARREWDAEGLKLHAEVQLLVGRIHEEVERLKAAGPVDVAALEGLLDAASEWPIDPATARAHDFTEPS